MPKKHTEETKRKISEKRKQMFASGKIQPWNKGKKGVQVPWNKGLKGEDYLKHFKKGIAKEKKLNLPDDEIISDYENGMTMNKLSRKNGCNISSIRRRLVENDIPIRDRRTSVCSAKGYLRNISISDYLLQVLDGVLLGDGSYRSTTINNETGYFSIEQSTEHKQWIDKIKELFDKHGIEYGEYFRTRKPVKKTCEMVALQSHSYKEFGVQYKRWYPNGKKRVPSDINLTPIVLAHWYMGDGHLGSSHYKKYNRNYYTLRLCTDGLLKEDIEFLQKQLLDKYGYKFLIRKEGKAWRLKINHRDIVRDFLIKTSTEMVDCFKHNRWRALYDPSHEIDRKYSKPEKIS